MLKIAAWFEVYQDAGHHYWVLRDWDGAILARNGGYVTRSCAMQDIERLRATALTANVVEASRDRRDARQPGQVAGL